MGRPKRHPILRRLDGNPGKRPLHHLLIVPDGAPFIPEHLEDDAQACMDLITASMPPGVYAKADTFLLSAFATAWGVHKRAVEALHAQPLVVSGAKGGKVQNPLVQVINSQARLMVGLGARLGLDPVARLGLRLPAERPRSKFDGLLVGRDDVPGNEFDA